MRHIPLTGFLGAVAFATLGACDSVQAQDAFGGRVDFGQRQEKVFGGNELVLHFRCKVGRQVQNRF